jgi:uncharacterized protein (UPF0548 family)
VWAVLFGPLRPRVACRVVRVLRDEVVDGELASHDGAPLPPEAEARAEARPRSTGFLHAALLGHPQRGWESYLVTHHPDDRVTLDVRVVWRPGAWWMRAAGPLTGVALRLLLGRGLRALDPVLRS